MRKTNLKSLKKTFRPLTKKIKSLNLFSCDYTYPDNNTLINKYGIKDAQSLDKKCARDSEKAAVYLRQETLPEKFDSSYLKYLHKRLFTKTFEWAGCTRDLTFKFENGITANISKMQIPNSDAFFKDSKKVSKSLHKFDQILAEKNNLQGLSREDFIEEAVKLFSFLNYIHPFRDGNGRTQQMFFEKLGEAAGHKLDFSVVTKKRMIHACNSTIPIKSNVNYEAMQHLFEDISNPEKTRVLKDYVYSASRHRRKFLNEQIIITPRENIEYTGIYKNSNADSIIIETVDLYIVCCKDYFAPEQLKALKLGDKITFKIPINKNLNQILIPAEKLTSLTLEEMLKKVKDTAVLTEDWKEIKCLSKIVYGSSKVLDQSLDMINQEQGASEKIAQQILKYPQSISKLAGFKIWFIKSPKRIRAERKLSLLSRKIKEYGYGVGLVKNMIIRNHEIEKKRLAQEIKLPGEAVQNILNMSPSEREKVFNGEDCVEIQKELFDFLLKIESRLSIDETKALKIGDHKKLAQSINMSEHKAKILIKTVRETKKVYRESQQFTVNKLRRMAVAV
ncbi:BID domain-containing T4SS effector [Bartonella sp. C271]|uniref:BID domain-containing T4SS effector n=1 Tax=Bartonella sp. C271 TaxID=3070220 RepID=UPI0038B528DA